MRVWSEHPTAVLQGLHVMKIQTENYDIYNIFIWFTDGAYQHQAFILLQK
jgi:hypothetical protein